MGENLDIVYQNNQIFTRKKYKKLLKSQEFHWSINFFWVVLWNRDPFLWQFPHESTGKKRAGKNIWRDVRSRFSPFFSLLIFFFFFRGVRDVNLRRFPRFLSFLSLLPSPLFLNWEEQAKNGHLGGTDFMGIPPPRFESGAESGRKRKQEKKLNFCSPPWLPCARIARLLSKKFFNWIRESAGWDPSRHYSTLLLITSGFVTQLPTHPRTPTPHISSSHFVKCKNARMLFRIPPPPRISHAGIRVPRVSPWPNLSTWVGGFEGWYILFDEGKISPTKFGQEFFFCILSKMEKKLFRFFLHATKLKNPLNYYIYIYLYISKKGACENHCTRLLTLRAALLTSPPLQPKQGFGRIKSPPSSLPGGIRGGRGGGGGGGVGWQQIDGSWGPVNLDTRGEKTTNGIEGEGEKKRKRRRWRLMLNRRMGHQGGGEEEKEEGLKELKFKAEGGIGREGGKT